MKTTARLVLLALLLAACGGNTAAPTSTASIDAGSSDLSGVSFEVHQEPG